MSSNFEKNSIRLTETPATKVSPPDSSKDIKLFQENGEVKVKDFAGNVKPLVPPMELKVAQVAVNTSEDANEYVLRIPSPNAKLIALEATLRDLIATSDANTKVALESALASLASWKDSQELANGNFDASIQDLESKVSELINEVASKASQVDVTNSLNAISSDLIRIVENINATLAGKAGKTEVAKAIAEVRAEIPKPVAIVADSSNVTITKKDANTYGIAVDIQEKVIETVIDRVGGGGISQKKVIELIEQYGGGGGGTSYSVEVSVSPATAEIGSTINPVEVSWVYSGGFLPVVQTLNSIQVPSTSYSDVSGVSVDKTYTLVSENAGGTQVTDSASITFGYRRYFGGYATDTAIQEVAIEALSSDLVLSREKEFTVDCSGGKRVVFAYPVALGLATVRDGNGFLFNDFYTGTSPTTVSITNSYGQNTNYYVYQTYNLYNSATVTFSFA